MDRSPYAHHIEHRVAQLLAPLAVGGLPHDPKTVEQALSIARWMAQFDLEDDAIQGSLIYKLYSKKDCETLPWPAALEPAKRFALALMALGHLEFKPLVRWSGAQAETIRRMLLAVVSDPRLVVARVAEQWCLLHEAKQWEEPAKLALAQQTREVFAPLAARLGLHTIKWELEDWAFRYLEPEEYHRIAKGLNERRVDREHYLEQFMATLSRKLTAAGIAHEISGRAKHIFSIWRKMVKKNYPLERIFDIRAVRLVVDDVPACYAALSVVHEHFEFLSAEFDDYIATPKANGYRSIHTAVLGSAEKIIEIQIRTPQMHEQAELGFAAHWRYKENRQANRMDEKVALLRELLSPSHNPDDALERVSSTLFKDHIYVLSPQGDVIELPHGATALDFAYHVHTQLGHRARGALIDGHMMALSTPLENGQRVEIISQKQAQPSRDWLLDSSAFITTKSAKAKVRSWFKTHDYAQHLKDGKASLHEALNRKSTLTAEDVALALKFKSVDDLAAALGSGVLSKDKLAAAILRLQSPVKADASDEIDHLPKPTSAPTTAGGLTVMGVNDLLCHLARCCKPIKPEPIQGYLTVSRGVSLHRVTCKNLAQLSRKFPERLIPVHWGQSNERYGVEISVVAVDRTGLIRDLSAVLSEHHVSIERMNTRTSKHLADVNCTLAVNDVSALAIVLERLRLVDGVVSVRRL